VPARWQPVFSASELYPESPVVGPLAMPEDSRDSSQNRLAIKPPVIADVQATKAASSRLPEAGKPERGGR